MMAMTSIGKDKRRIPTKEPPRSMRRLKKKYVFWLFEKEKRPDGLSIFSASLLDAIELR